MRYPEDFINRIICGDNLEVMKDIPNGAIVLTVTSPPYGDLRDYKGFSFDYKKLMKELFKVIKVGGILVWVVGDQTINGSESGNSFRQALYAKEVGFKLYDTMIYLKNNLPFPQLKRYNQIFEYMFVLSKRKPKTLNLLERKNIYGAFTRSMTHRQKNGDMKETKNVKYKNKSNFGNVWLYDGGYMKSTKDKIAYKHPAIFPDELAQDHIISWSNKGDVVLDPMCGSGTTCKMAKKLGRRFIGIDVSPEYCEIARKRVNSIPESLF